MADIFISYSNEDKSTVKQLAGLLQNRGWTVWWDRDIPVGETYDRVIERELNSASCVIVLWTQRSVNSEWVRNEAGDAANRKKLLPVLLEQVTIPLEFRRIEAAILTDWDSEVNHPELDNLDAAVQRIVNRQPGPVEPAHNKKLLLYRTVAAVAFVTMGALVFCYFYFINAGNDFRFFYPLIFLTGILAGIFVYSILNIPSVRLTGLANPKYKLQAIITTLAVIVTGVLLLPQSTPEKIVTIRLFDWKKNPVTQGDVKLYLKEYIRTQSVDKMGQALFTSLPPEMFQQKIKIEVSSPGYVARSFDTIVNASKPMELTMPLTTVVFISGRVTTAADAPIRGVEIDADGTRYYAMSLNDGTYKLRLEEYTLGDEITLTTSHKDYEDKTISVKINSPEITDKNIVLNPLH